MLVPDNVKPEQTIYFNGSIVLKTLQDHSSLDVLELYSLTKEKRQMNMFVFSLCLDWLYLINLIKIDEKGMVELCS